ncbi:nuclear transport factor 2 family protein [Roseovarius sp.]|uniref:nuclear transport factor 2 family protein n=1 Tax=Roseovarius sp. TaxID=1486281 RepID=UPI003A985F25
MSKPQAEGIVHIDDVRFKVTEWRFAPGAETGWHVHGHDYVVVPLTDGTLGLDNAGGTAQTAALTQGVPYSRREGVNHNVTNAGTAPLAFLEIEAVAEASALRRREVLERFMAAWNARDLDALMACMATECAFNAAAGPEAEGHHVSGHDGVRAAYATVFDTFPEAAWTAGTHHVFGDTGLSEWRFTGTDKAGQRVDVHGCDIFRFEGDLIALKDTYRKARSA